MSGLFGQAGAGGGGGAPTGVVFNAGKCEFDGTTVTPVKEKGQVSVGKVCAIPSSIYFFNFECCFILNILFYDRCQTPCWCTHACYEHFGVR